MENALTEAYRHPWEKTEALRRGCASFETPFGRSSACGNPLMGFKESPHPEEAAKRPSRRTQNADTSICDSLSAPLFLDVGRQLRTCERPWIFDIDGQMLGRFWGRGHQAHPLGRVEAVPRSLRDNDDHPGAQRVGLRTVLRDDVQCRRAVDDLHELVAIRVALPGAVAGEFCTENVAVAEWSQCGEGTAALPVGLGHLRPAPVQDVELPQLGLQIDDCQHVSTSNSAAFGRSRV